MKDILSNKLVYNISAFLIPFIVYLITLAPSVSFIDCGELATVCIKLGVAHPTGYPLFTLIGKIFSLLPFSDSPIYKLNLMAAFLCSISAVLFFNLMVFLLKDKTFTSQNAKLLKLKDETVFLISLSTALILAFSKTFWETANAIEVYSLHILFLLLNIYLFLKACSYTISAKDEIAINRYWIIFAFILGLSFTNHLSTIFLSVGFIYLYFSVNGFNKFSFRRILFLAVPFLAGYSVYIYLFVRADNPVISWGYPHNFENFWRHFTGKQFSIWMFSSFENAGKQFSHFTKTFPAEYFYLPLIIAIPGLKELFGRSRKLFYFTLLLFGFCVIYAVNYDIYDIDSYFLLAFIVGAIWIGYGLVFIAEKFKAGSKHFAAFSLLIFLLPLWQNFSEADESDNYFVKDYTMNIFRSAPENSIIFSVQWDFWVSASMYYQYVQNIRPDLVVIDKELLRKTWYMHYIKQHYPEIYNNSLIEFETYMTELVKFEMNSEPYTNPRTEADRQNSMKIQQAFLDLLNSLVDKNINQRNFFYTFEVEQNSNERFAADYNRIPQGLLIRLTKGDGIKEWFFPEMDFTITHKEGYHHEFIMNAYYTAYLSNANYLMNFSRFNEAERLIRKAMEIKPQAPDAGRLLNKLNQLKSIPGN